MIEITFRDTFSTVQHKVKRYLRPSFEILRSDIYLVSYSSIRETVTDFIVSIEGIEREYEYIKEIDKYKKTINFTNLPLSEQGTKPKGKRYRDVEGGYDHFLSIIKTKNIYNGASWFVFGHDHFLLIVINKKDKNLCSAQINRLNGELIVFESGLFI